MKSVEEILAQVNANLPKVDTVPDAKKQAVAAASQAKMAAMGAQATPQDFANAAIARASNGQGYTSANEVGRALIEDSPVQLYDKFGADVAQRLIEERALATGSNNLARQQLQGRTTPEAVKDTAVGVTQGVVGLATGLGTLTASGVDAALGTDLAVDAAAFNKATSEFIKQGYSDEVTADDKLSAARMNLNQRDNAYIAAQEEMNGVDPLNAGIKRIAQDFSDQLGELGNSEFQAERVISEGVGSMLPVGMVSKGVAATGRAALGAATTRGILAAEGKAAIALAKYGNAVRTPAVIGATEGGSAGSDAINQVMAMTSEQLSADPEFGSKFKALAADIGVERAKREIAIEAGDTSIAVGGLAGAAIGRIASKFEGDIFAKVGTKQAVGNIAREGVEETGQGMASQFGTNLAIQQNADSNKELADTVGSAGALGLVGGLGAAASVSPASTTKAVLAPATYLGSKLVDKIVSIGESIEASAQAASPVSDHNVMKAATAAKDTVATARQEAADLVTADTSPEAKASSAYVTALADVLELTPPQPDEIPSDLHDTLLDKTSVVDVLQAIPKALNDPKVSEASKNLLVSFALNSMLSIKNTVAQGEDSLSVDSKYENLAQYAQAYEGVLKGLLQSPATQSVAAHFNTLIEDGLKTGLLKPIEPSKLAEPEEQANLDKILTIAQNTEGAIPESVAGTIMDMAANPPVGLTAKQGSALKAIAAELIAAKEYAAKAEELGLKKVEFVSKQITTNEESDNPKGQNSARIHARGISAAIMAGKPKEAKARITELANFVTHLNNKVKALNEHIAAGMPKGGVYYQAYKVKNSSKPWSKSRKALSYQKSNPEFARTIALEAETLASIYENLRKAFPELKAPKIAPISLVEGATTVATQTQEDAVPTTNQSGRTAAEVESDKKVSKELRAKFEIGEGTINKHLANKMTDKIAVMDKDALLAVKAIVMKYSVQVRRKSPNVKFIMEQLIARNAELAKEVKVETPTDPAPTADTKVETTPVSQLTPDAKVETPTSEQEAALKRREANKVSKAAKRWAKFVKDMEEVFFSNRALAMESFSELEEARLKLKKEIEAELGTKYSFLTARDGEDLVRYLETIGDVTQYTDRLNEIDTTHLASALTYAEVIEANPDEVDKAIIVTSDLPTAEKIKAAFSGKAPTKTNEESLVKYLYDVIGFANSADFATELSASLRAFLNIINSDAVSDSWKANTVFKEMVSNAQHALDEASSTEKSDLIGIDKTLAEISSIVKLLRDTYLTKLGKEITEENTEAVPTNENTNPLVQSKTETEEADTKAETGTEEVLNTETATTTEPAKKDKVTLKSVFANLLLPNNNKFLQAFKLTSRSRFLLAEGSLFENISKAISSPQAMAKFMGEEVSAKHLRLTPALSQAYKNLLQSYRASIYAGLNGEIKNILGKAVVTDKTSLPVIYRILRNELQAKTEDKNAVLQALIDGSHKGTAESLQKLVDGYQTADATSRLLNKELKAEQATLDALKAAKIPDPKAVTAQQVVVQKLFTELQLLELDRRPDLKNVLTELKKNLIKNWKTLDPYLMAIRADLHTAENGRLLNFVEVNADGVYVLNTKIANIAVMATLQWAMEISQSVPGKLEAKDVAALTGLDISKVTLSLINEVNSGVTQIKAIESLSQLIQSMLGLKSNSKEVMGNTDGIIRGLAASLIALVREGKTNADAGRVLIGVSEPTNLGEKLPKHVNIYKPMIKASETAFAEFSDLFEMLADTEFTPDVFVGSDVTIPVNKSVLNSPLLPLTDAQIKAVEKAQAVEQKLDEGVLEFYQQLGEEGFIEVFGEGEIDVSLHNKVDAESKSSRNKVLLQGWKHIKAVLAEAKAYAEHTDTALKDVIIRYASDMSSVSRLQYRGVSNQSNKLVRSLITPTITTIRFDDAEKVTVYKLALAQAMGIKIHNMSTEQALTKLSELMSDPIVKEAYSLIKRKEITPSNFSVLKAAKNKVDGTIRGMTALMDAARYEQMKDDGKEEFITSVAIEADGVTNGIANALHLLGNEPITEQMLANWKATGYFVGSRDRTLNQERQVNSLDMYTVIAAKASKYVEASRKAIMKGVDKKAPVINQMMEMFRLLSSDVEFDAESGMITIKRSGTKNPTTISLYGSSENGIAAKVANALLQELYATMSEWIQSDDKTPRNYHEIKAAFQAITGNEIGFNGTKNTWFIKSGSTAPFFPNNREQLLDFQIKPDLFEVMQNNIKHLYVAPMRVAIDDVLGSGVMDAMTTIIQTTSIQSLIMKARFEKAVKKAVKLKAKTVPGYRESDYLSKDELTQIHIEVVRSSFGMYSNGEQNFLVAGSVSSDAVNTGGKIASSTSGAVSSKPVVQSFENSGVAGAPTLNIGLGDAYAVIRALINDKIPANLLWVFDGIEASINDIAALAKVANEAVRDSWFNQSPAKVVAESWKKFAPTITQEDLSSELIAALAKMNGLKVEEFPPRSVLGYIEDFMNNRIQDLATKTEAMQSVKRELVSSIDQMASIGIPFTNEGSVDLSGKTDAEIIETINTMFKERLPKESKPAESKTHPTTKAVANGLMEAVQSILGGYRNKTTGVYAFKGKQLDKLLKHLKNLPTNQRRVYNDVISVAAKSLADIDIVIGSFAETIEHFKNNEQISSHMANKPNTQGTYFGGLNTIVIRADRTETLIHELIHATTMKAVKDYLLHKTNPAKYPLPDVKLKALTESVENIMKMMNDFYSDQYIMNLDSSAVAKYEHVKDVIKKNLTKAQAAGTTEDAAAYQAVAVDEFLAYILASETLAEAASKTTTATGSSFREFILRMIKGVGKSIAALFKTSPQFNQGRDDLFNNLVFNSTILASYNNKPSFLENLVPFMNQDGFEDVDRLQALQDSVKNAVAAFMDTTSVPKDKVADAIYNEMKVVNTFNKLAKEASATIVGAGFQLNALEQQTYEVLLTAMTAGLKLNSVALGKIQTIYGEFSKQLTAKDFLDTSLSENTGRYVAGNKLAIILGQFNNAKLKNIDVLASFVALSAVSPELQALLNKFTMPEKTKVKGDKFDVAVTRVGEELTNALSGHLSSGSKNKAVDDLVFDLVETLFKADAANKFVSSSMAVAVAEGINSANEYVSENLQKGAKTVHEKAAKVSANSNNRVVKFSAHAAIAASIIVDKDIANSAAENTNKFMNGLEGYDSVRAALSDIIGRTTTNSGVYDLIKPIRVFVAKARQEFKERVPSIIKEKFVNVLDKTEWSHVNTVVANTNLVSLGAVEALAVLSGKRDVNKLVNDLERNLKTTNSKYFGLVQGKAKQLANFMVTGEAGDMLLRNSFAISKLYGMNVKDTSYANTAYINKVERLVSLYALQAMSQEQLNAVEEIANANSKGMLFVLTYMKGIAEENQRKVNNSSLARDNGYTGFLSNIQESSSKLIVASDTEYAKLIALGFTRIDDYKGDPRESMSEAHGYYFNAASVNRMFQQGTIQNVHVTVSGVNVYTGWTDGSPVAGRITDAIEIAKILSRKGKASKEPLLPLFDSTGSVIAFERSLSVEKKALIEYSTDLAKRLGATRGRQHEEIVSQHYNQVVIDNLKQMYDKDPNKSQYVDLFDNKALAKDPVLKDAVALFTEAVREQIKDQFGEEFYVKREVLMDVVGYRAASLTDPWTGVSRLSPKTLKTMKGIAYAILGKDAFTILNQYEDSYQDAIAFIKTNIVVKSVVVPFANIMGNIVHLMSVGVSPYDIYKQVPKKMLELEYLITSQHRLTQIEAELFAAKTLSNKFEAHKLEAESKSIHAALDKLSIIDLINAGELSNINDIGFVDEDASLLKGNFKKYFDDLSEQIPEGVKTVGKHLIVGKDTALFAGLQKSVLYGDFIAKAILFDSLVQKGQSKDDVLARISEEFVNYDKLPGRGRGYLESMGLLWFYNFKLRSIKVALSAMRNNPLHVLIASLGIGYPLGVETGIGDNAIAQVMEGSIGYSIGIDMGISGLSTNPYANMIH